MCNRVGHCGGDVRIVDGIRRVRAKVVHRERAAPEKVDERRSQCNSGMVARDGHRADIRFRRQRRGAVGRLALAQHRHATLFQGVCRQRGDVTALGQQHRLAAIEHTRVGFGNNLEAFHYAPTRDSNL